MMPTRLPDLPNNLDNRTNADSAVIVFPVPVAMEKMPLISFEPVIDCGILVRLKRIGQEG